jgi:hypothetical protein
MKHVTLNKAERLEKKLLESIFTDPTKDEEQREFARERLQALRDGAIARLKSRRAAKAGEKSEDDTPVPTLDECGDEETYRAELELHHILLDERAAKRVLDSSKSGLTSRDNASRTLRKCAERRHELYPDHYGNYGTGKSGRRRIRTKLPDVPADTRPFAEREPFEGFAKRHPNVLEAPNPYHSWQSICTFRDGTATLAKLKKDDPEEHAKCLPEMTTADAERRSRY